MICFRNKDKDLDKCVVSTSDDYNASNLMRHLKHAHLSHFNRIVLDKESAPEAKQNYDEIIDIGSYEKQLVYLEKREGSVSSPVWKSDYFRVVSIIPNWDMHIGGTGTDTLNMLQLVHFSNLCLTTLDCSSRPDFSKYNGLVKISKAKGACVCMLCFHDKDKNLEQCVLSTNDSYSASNLMRHLKNSHLDRFHEMMIAKDPTYDQQFQDDPNDNNNNNNNEHEMMEDTATNNNINDNTMKEDFGQMNPNVALEVWERKVYTFFNTCRIPARFASSPEFKELMAYTVRNGPTLKPNLPKFLSDMRSIHRLPSHH